MTSQALLRRPSPPGSGFGRAFWMCYAANIAQMIAVSLLFRYADFVHYLDGSDFQLGLITGVGMTGSLLMRVVQGGAIDRIGPRRVWLISLAGFITSLLGHCFLGSVHGPSVFLLRILMMVSLAGAFGASLTHVTLLAPPHRMAEFIGVLGSSGFVGMALGPVLGDYLLGGVSLDRLLLNRMFFWAAAMGSAAMLLAAGSGQASRRPARKTRPALWPLITRYHPGPLMLVGVAMGLGLGLPGVFVRPFAASLGIDRIKIYFLVYAVTAFTIRFATRRWTDRYGVRPITLAGVSMLAASMLTYCLVTSVWTLAIPAIATGIAHALLFPAVVAGAGQSFPVRYRGLATNLILAMFDLGGLVGQPLAGAILRLAGGQGWPRFQVMFVVMAVLLFSAAVWFAASRPRTLRRPTRLFLPQQVRAASQSAPDSIASQTIVGSAAGSEAEAEAQPASASSSCS